jgi:hypothetical protein
MAGSAWSLAVPLFASYDESAHVVHAVALVHGQFVGHPVDRPGQVFSHLDGVDLPEYWSTADSTVNCFITKTGQSAACDPGFSSWPRNPAEALTWVARYPPAYYAVVGIPSLALQGAPAVYAMRLVSSVLTCALLAAGMTALRSTRFPRAASAAGLLCLTPTLLCLTGMVNPSGFEIAAGFATWAFFLPVLLDPGAGNVPRRVLGGSVALGILVNARPASGVMAALIGVTLAVLVTRKLADRLRGPLLWGAGGVVAVAGVAAVGWTIRFHPTSTLGGWASPQLANPAKAVLAALRQSRQYLVQQIGSFWDTPAPLLTLAIWTVLLGAVITLAFAFGRRRARMALALGVVLLVAVPVVSQVPTAARLGMIWQGRYLMPYSIGLPMLAIGVILSRRDGRRLMETLVPGMIGLTVIGQLASLGWAMWRYSYGLDHVPLARPAGWIPPVGMLLPVVLATLSIAGTALLAYCSPRVRGSAGARAHLPVGEAGSRDVVDDDLSVPASWAVGTTVRRHVPPVPLGRGGFAEPGKMGADLDREAG